MTVILETLAVGVPALALAAAFLKSIHDHGKSTGELASAVSDNTKATVHLTASVEKIDGTLLDHEIRLAKLEILRLEAMR